MSTHVDTTDRDADSDILLMQSAMISLAAIGEESDALARISDTTETLNDVITVVPSMESATATDLFLINSTAYMATAGTDIALRDVTRRLQNGGTRISMEGFKSFLAGLWRTMLATLRRIWQVMSKFFRAVFGLVTRLRASVFLLRRKCKEKPDYDKRRPERITLGAEYYMLSEPDTVEELNGLLDATVAHADFYFGEFASIAVQAYDDVIDGMEGFDSDNEDTRLNTISSDAISIAQRNYPPLYAPERTVDSRFTNEYWVGPDLPNRKSVFIRRVPIPQTNEPLLRAEAIMQNYVSVQATKAKYEHVGPKSDDNEFPTPNMSTIMFWLEKIDLMLDHVVAFEKSLDKIDAMRGRLVEVTDDLVERMEELNDNEASLTPYYRTAIRFNSYLSTAFINPCSQIANIVLSTSRAVLIISQKSMRTIEPVVQH
jgi:hypothetical protein